MAERIQIDRIGLCETCLRTIRSVLRANRGTDPICCEVLDNCRAGLDEQHGFGCTGGDFVGVASNESKPRIEIGLCANCALVDECTRPRPESGVWHCEDYK